MANIQEIWNSVNVYAGYETRLLSKFPDVKYALSRCCIEWLKAVLVPENNGKMAHEIKKAVLVILNAPQLDCIPVTEYSLSGLNLIYYSMFLSLGKEKHPASTPVPKTMEVSDLIRNIVSIWKKEGIQ